MDPLVSAPKALPTLVTGDRSTWIAEGALVGAVTGYVGPAAALLGFTLHPWLLACALAFAAGGAALGATVPPVLERLRGRVPLVLIGTLLTTSATLGGLLWAGAAAAAVGAPVSLASTYGGVAAGGLVALFWLPYTVLAVLGRPRWPVVVAAGVASAGLGWLARWLFLAMVSG